MGAGQEPEQLTWAWSQQRIWSQSANRLKQHIDQARLAALLLGIATAVLAVAADQVGGLSMPAGRALSAAAAIAAGLATLLATTGQHRADQGLDPRPLRLRRAEDRNLRYLGGGTAYPCPDPATPPRPRPPRSRPGRDQRLGAATRGIVEAVSGLQRHTLGIEPDTKVLPGVRDVGSYITLRVDDQIHNYYDKKAAAYEARVRHLRTMGDLLGITAVVLAAVAAAFQVDRAAAWVPVVTTVGASLAAYVAAARYDYMVIEYLRTAQRLEHLRRDYL